MAKQYGLFVPNKNKSALPAAKLSIFNDDSDSDDGKKNIPTVAQQKVVKRQDLLAQRKALAEDPTIFQYDEVYDDIENTRQESKLARKDIEKKPKYINRLLQAAARRKRENDRRIEKQVQKEREEEGDEFQGKEEFVTAAYRKKLEEFKELEEIEKREEYLETIGDVTKQADLGGFYRHLYEQRLKSPKRTETTAEKTPQIEDIEEKTAPKNKMEATQERKYRRRKQSHSENSDSDAPTETVKENLQHLQSNLDADSDFSIESSDSENETEKTTNASVDIKSKDTENLKNQQEADKPADPIVKNEPLEFEPEHKQPTPPPEPEFKKPKIDIWKKRTVGTVFDKALQRYYVRKSVRLTTVQ